MLVLDGDCPQAAHFKDSTANQGDIDFPEDQHSALDPIMKDYEWLFGLQLGKTNAAKHVIDIIDARPVKVSPRPVLFQYQDRVHEQFQEMAAEGIIQPRYSPWCAPAVCVPKS